MRLGAACDSVLFALLWLRRCVTLQCMVVMMVVAWAVFIYMVSTGSLSPGPGQPRRAHLLDVSDSNRSQMC